MDNNYNSQQNGFSNDSQQGNAYYNTQQNGYMNNTQQNNGYYNPQQNYYMNNNTQDKGKTSMICGIASIVLCFIGWFCCIGYSGVALAIVAIIFANQTKQVNGGEMTKEGKIGMITGIVGLGVLLLGFGVGLVIGMVSVMGV